MLEYPWDRLCQPGTIWGILRKSVLCGTIPPALVLFKVYHVEVHVRGRIYTFFMFCNHILNVLWRSALIIIVTVAVTALSFTRLLSSQPTAAHTPCIIIIVTFHLFMLILVCEYVFTIDVFRETFNMLMVLVNVRVTTGWLNLCTMNAIQITHKNSG